MSSIASRAGSRAAAACAAILCALIAAPLSATAEPARRLENPDLREAYLRNLMGRYSQLGQCASGSGKQDECYVTLEIDGGRSGYDYFTATGYSGALDGTELYIEDVFSQLMFLVRERRRGTSGPIDYAWYKLSSKDGQNVIRKYHAVPGDKYRIDPDRHFVTFWEVSDPDIPVTTLEELARKQAESGGDAMGCMQTRWVDVATRKRNGDLMFEVDSEGRRANIEKNEALEASKGFRLFNACSFHVACVYELRTFPNEYLGTVPHSGKNYEALLSVEALTASERIYEHIYSTRECRRVALHPTHRIIHRY